MEKEGAMKLTAADASTYLNKIKEVFPGEGKHYQCFLNLLSDWKSKRIDTESLVAGVEELFKGHTDLLLGFNIFCPKGHEMKLPMEEANPSMKDDQPLKRIHDTKENEQYPKNMHEEAADFVDVIKEDEKALKRMRREDVKGVDIVNKIRDDEHPPKGNHGGREEAAHIVENTNENDLPSNRMRGGYEEVGDFVKKIKTRLQDDVNVYNSFLDIMNMQGEGKKSMEEVYQEVVALFVNHTYLLQELKDFLLSTSGTKSA